MVFQPIVPSSRPVIGRQQMYDIDIREFLVTERNAVIKRVLETDFRTFVSGKPNGWEKFTVRAKGNFDFRAQAVAEWVGQAIEYDRKISRDPWQFAEETLTLRTGDCEDRAFLMASMLLASGISGYHVRVALGHVRTSGGKTFDHAWVMYKSEMGRWMLAIECTKSTDPGTLRRTAGALSSAFASTSVRDRRVCATFRIQRRASVGRIQ